VKLTLGTFACLCIETKLGLDLATGLEQAIRHYARRLESATQPVPFPRFLRGISREGAGTEVDVPLEPEIEAMLLRTSRAEEVPIKQLAAHAVFVYLADLEASGGFAANGLHTTA
jgi:hypothetical protein